jgi:hypothetical protein
MSLAVLVDRAEAQSNVVPERGSETRADILDALRPLAEWELGGAVEFVVGTLRVSDGLAFASVTAQRPGGGPIDLAATPMARREGLSLAEIDGPRLDALLRKSGRMWVAVLHGIGSTDVWYASETTCDVWAAVLPDFCT